jgi:NADPH:quinone reductase-like Zn-dependent oxidoreductase
MQLIQSQVTGREMSGIVEEVGENVKGIKKGDRVWTSTYAPSIHRSRDFDHASGTYYRDVRSGCFQQYVIAPKHTVKPIPSNMSFEAAACLGVCGLTAAMSLWKWLEIPIFDTRQMVNPSQKKFLLIWGGSSITGQFAIQIAAYSGYEVIAVASQRTEALVQDLGAKHVITRDGKSHEDIVAEIRAIGEDTIVKGIDIVGPETAVHCIAALSSQLPVIFAPLSFLPKGCVPPEHVSVRDVEMKWFILEKESEKYADALNRLLESDTLRVPELEILKGGLGRVEEGLNMQKRGDRGGKKLIVSLRN